MDAPQPQNSSRSGKILVLFAVLLPALLGFTGLVIDGGLLMAAQRNAQHIADAAAMAAAREKFLGESDATAAAVARDLVHNHNGLPDATVTLHVPPTQGPYAGRPEFVEVVLSHPVSTYLIHILGSSSTQSVVARSVAGYAPSTAGAAVVVLDPEPEPLSVLGLPALPISYPALIAGLEVLGLGQLQVQGAVHVNTQWGGVDENGDPAGDGPGPPWGVSCTPLLPLTKLLATDIRVAGGVDTPDNYGHVDGQSDSPLRANKLPVPDPFANLPVPTLLNDPTNVSATNYGGVQVVGLPLGPPTVLQPGVYDWIEIDSGRAVLNPGIYLIRGVNPTTQVALRIGAAEIQADGVMFYVTDSATYSVSDGLPDAQDGETPPAPSQTGLPPSVVINLTLANSSITPLDDPNSPFDGMTIYQRRHDRRPIVILKEDLLGSSSFHGTVYAKWGHLILGGKGTYNARFVVGTMRVTDVLQCVIAPDELLPPAQDVFLVE